MTIHVPTNFTEYCGMWERALDTFVSAVSENPWENFKGFLRRHRGKIAGVLVPFAMLYCGVKYFQGCASDAATLPKPSALERTIDRTLSFGEPSFGDLDSRELTELAKRYAGRKVSKKSRREYHLVPMKPIIKKSNYDRVIEGRNAFGRRSSHYGKALVKTESSFIQDTVSTAGCVGATQLSIVASNEVRGELGGDKNGYWELVYPQKVTLPGGKEIVYDTLNPNPDPNMDWRNDPRKNIPAGHAYLKKMTKRFDNNILIGLAAYNWGPTNVQGIIDNLNDQGIRKPCYDDIADYLPKEVSKFVRDVNGRAQMYNMYPPLKRFERVSTGFGRRIHPVTGKPDWHPRYDLTAPKGTPVHAMCDGIVAHVGWDKYLGNFVTIQHANSNFTSTYGHLSRVRVKKGMAVRRGRDVGALGRTGRTDGGYHLDVRAKENGKAAPFLKKYYNHQLPNYDLDRHKKKLAKKYYKRQKNS
jgi:murein DD-endopeptidase MepM/ murein hydrolase activator NlpD